MSEQETPNSERVHWLKERMLSSFMELPSEERAQFTLVLASLVMQSPHAQTLLEGLHRANVRHPEDVTIRATPVTLHEAGLSLTDALALSAEDYAQIGQTVRDHIALDVLPEELASAAYDVLEQKKP